MKNPIDMNLTSATCAASTVVEQVTAKIPLPMNFMQFCSFPACDIDWSRHGQLPNLTELSRLNRLRCKCRLDPMLICPEHRCNCNACNKHDKICSWRTLHASLLGKKIKYINVKSDHDKLTYCEILELNGKNTPSYARDRNLLNLMAYFEGPNVSLAASYLVFDISQSMNRLGERSDGTIGTIATSSKVYVMRTGSYLTERDLVQLCGLPVFTSFHQQTPSAVMNMLGNSMHISDVGVALGIAVFLKMNMISPV